MGVGVEAGIGTSRGFSTGLTITETWIAEGNFGAGESVGASLTTGSINRDVRYGLGAGVQLSAGRQTQSVLATPSLLEALTSWRE